MTTASSPEPAASLGATAVITHRVRDGKSAQYAAWIKEIRPACEASPGHLDWHSGLDFWFAPTGARAQVPVRWKQYLVTWSAIYPLALGVPLALGPALSWLGLADNFYLKTLAVTAVIVLLMVYVVMPRYARLVGRWLFS
ncbi:MAG: antibiotic biosynthesis monooxygenase [Lentisphaeria bacterium]